jgi:hypothetical protein
MSSTGDDNAANEEHAHNQVSATDFETRWCQTFETQIIQLISTLHSASVQIQPSTSPHYNFSIHLPGWPAPNTNSQTSVHHDPPTHSNSQPTSPRTVPRRKIETRSLSAQRRNSSFQNQIPFNV